MPKDWTRLGALVVARRVSLGMRKQKELAAKAGLTVRTIGPIENGARDSYDAGTLALVEIALEWAPGSIEAILAGGEPVPMGRVEPTGPRNPDFAEVRHLLDNISRQADQARRIMSRLESET